MRLFRRTLAAALFLCATSLHAALTADNLLLVVNKNSPEGHKLAEYYAQERHVPDGRIVALDLPTGDEIAADDFDEKIVSPLREFITNEDLRRQVTCIVTFYGVPLRIPARAKTPALREELVAVRKELAAATKQTESIVQSLEKLAAQIDPSFKPLEPPKGTHVEPEELLPRRAEYAAAFTLAKLKEMPNDAKRAELEAQASKISAEFREPVAGPVPSTAPGAGPTTQESLTPQQIAQRMNELSQHRGDPAARRTFREFVREHAGIIMYLQIVAAQEQYLNPDDSDAAVDNELAAMWWGLYPRFRWQGNPLNYKVPQQSQKTMMVMRLDGGSPTQVRSIIDTSIKVEKEGLSGKVVLDSRGIAPVSASGKPDGYGIYDQSIRDLAVMIHNDTKLDLLADDRPTLIPPGSVKGVAVYCGWYSPGKFVPSVSLVPGAVAVHIASFEMTTLHGATADWCRNLLDSGAVATFGPVAEPYLHAFPPANEFFGLLFTGKRTLAETYWATNPLVSWKMAMVGDPLYVPFKVNPPLKPQDLPQQMQEYLDRRE